MKNSLLLWSGLAAVALVAIAASGLLFRKEACRDFREGRITTPTTTLRVTVADNDQERIQGLISCPSLPENSGMYFPYAEAKNVNYWMRGMLIPLDVIWVAQGTVVGVEANLPPVEKTAVDPPIYQPPQPVDAVLEVAGGKAAQYGLATGVKVTFERK